MSRLSIALILNLIMAGSVALTSTVPYPLQNRVKDADLIVVGTLTDMVKRRFSVIYHDYHTSKNEVERFGNVEHEYWFDVGTIVVDEVVKGIWGKKKLKVAWRAGYKCTPDTKPRMGFYDPELMFQEGSNGIWILRGNRVILREYYGATYLGALVPLDSLATVKEYVKRDCYVKTRK